MMPDVEPSVLSMIVDKIDALEKNLDARLGAQDAQLRDIKTQTAKTNGRVTVLEQARARAQGVMSAYSWLPSVLSAVLGAGLTIMVIALTGGIRIK